MFGFRDRRNKKVGEDLAEEKGFVVNAHPQDVAFAKELLREASEFARKNNVPVGTEFNIICESVPEEVSGVNPVLMLLMKYAGEYGLRSEGNDREKILFTRLR